MLADPALDADMREIGSGRGDQARAAEVEALTQAIRVSLLPKDAADEGNVILEVRAGTGGDEAALFAGDLFRMYVKYAESSGWKVDVLSASEGTAGGYKEIIAEIAGPRRLRASEIRKRRASRPARAGDGNAGAHPHVRRHRRRHAGGEGDRRRDQREPTSRSTRCAPAAPAANTSTRRNRRFASPILPTGVVVAMQEERSQHRNRAKAMALLRSRILDAERQTAERNGRGIGARRSAPATVRSASAPIIFRKAG